MRKKLLNTLIILLACVLSVAAQETKDKKIKIKIIEEVDGERKVVEREYGSQEEMKNDPALKDMNIEFLEKTDGFSFKSKDGDHVIIKRTGGEEGLHEKDMHVFITDDEEGDLHMDNTFMFKSFDDDQTVDFKAGDHTFEIRKDDEGNVIVIKDGEVIEDFEFSEDGMANGENLFFFKSDDDDHKKTVIRHVKVRKIHVENISKKDPELENLDLDNKKKLNVDGLSYYPNPSEGALNLAFKADPGAVEVKISDINGNTVYQDVMSDFEGVFDKSIDLSSQPSGIYILQIIQGDRAINKKLVIE
ncbi:MAG: T9SS type A sorting domain-containing protein [Fulvivirga sp.]